MVKEALDEIVRKLLDRLVEASTRDNDEREAVADSVAAAVRQLPSEGFLDAVTRAIGRSGKRKEQAIYLLSERLEIPDVGAKISEWIRGANSAWRAALVQEIRLRGLSQFGNEVTAMILSDPDPFCRDMAIHTAASLRIAEALPAILELAKTPGDLKWRLEVALQEYATEDCRPYLATWFADANSTPSDRVICAWGLAKLGDTQAYDYLIKMLGDPDVQIPHSYSSLESLRAAQAICDVKGWPFEWHMDSVARTKERVSQASPRV